MCRLGRNRQQATQRRQWQGSIAVSSVNIGLNLTETKQGREDNGRDPCSFWLQLPLLLAFFHASTILCMGNKDNAAATMEPCVTFMHMLIMFNTYTDRQTEGHTVRQISVKQTNVELTQLSIGNTCDNMSGV